MTELNSTFDAGTAVPLLTRVQGSPHSAYRDAHGNVCLVCIGSSEAGGVPVNEAARQWLREQPGEKFVRLINSISRFDKTLELDRLPKKPTRDGKLGRYTFYDPADFGEASPFPPPVDDGEPM